MKLIVNNKQKDLEEAKAATLQFQRRCGAFFREKRILQNRTEEDLADFLKIPVQMIHDYESGREAIPLNRVDALSRFLKIPPEEIIELHLDLENTIMPHPLFERDIIADQDAAKVIHQARKTVFLSPKDLARLLSQAGYPVSENEILQIENGKKEVTVEFWLNFCALTHLHVDAIQGYSRWEHLARVNVAFKNHEARIPIGSKLLNALENYRSANKANNHKLAFLLRFSMAFRRK